MISGSFDTNGRISSITSFAVAEKKLRWICFGNVWLILAARVKAPSFNNWSTSSNTNDCSCWVLIFLALINSNTRPGVPIKTSGLSFSFSTWRFVLAPPISGRTVKPMAWAHSRATSVTCIANSCEEVKINS